MWYELVKTLAPFILAFLGAYFGYLFALKRDRKAKRQELVIQYLIDAYRNLARLPHRVLTPELKDIMVANTQEIQLFGSYSEIAEMIQYVEAFVEDSTKADMETLLCTLRKDLRKELKLEPLEDLEGKIRHLRFVDDPQDTR